MQLRRRENGQANLAQPPSRLQRQDCPQSEDSHIADHVRINEGALIVTLELLAADTVPAMAIAFTW